jgi:glycosyltransferase involved in cell wall biosynthesis
VNVKWSVVIPVFRRRPWLDRAILSAKMSGGEMIVADFGSYQDVEIFKRVITLAPHYGLRKTPTMAGDWNAALRLATGDYVHLLHDDDYVLPGFYESCERELAFADAVATGYRNETESGVVTFRQDYRNVWLPEAFEHSNPLQVCAVAARREVFGPFDEDPQMWYVIDWDAWRRIKNWRVVPECLAVFQEHPGQESTRGGKQECIDYARRKWNGC